MKCLCGSSMYLSTDGYWDRDFEDTWYCGDDKCRGLFYTNIVRDSEGNPLNTAGKWGAKDRESFRRLVGFVLAVWDEVAV